MRLPTPRKMKPVHHSLGPVMESIISARIKQQCTIEQMAERTGWSYSAIWNYENKLKRVPLAYAEDAAAALGLEIKAVAQHDR